MRTTHGCHSDRTLARVSGQRYKTTIDRATHSSSQRSPNRIGSPSSSSSQAANRYQQRPPDFLPRRAFAFQGLPNLQCITGLNLCDKSANFGQILAKISA